MTTGVGQPVAAGTHKQGQGLLSAQGPGRVQGHHAIVVSGCKRVFGADLTVPALRIAV